MNSQEIKFSEVPFSRIVLGKRDVIVIKVLEGRLSDATKEFIKLEASIVFPNNKILVLENGLDIEIVSGENK
jgi:hypothetical protein